MLKDITIGKYYNRKSLIHNLDCRTKLASTILFIIAIFWVKNPIVYIPCFVYVLILYKLANIPISHMIKGLKGFAVLLVFTFIFQSSITAGREIFSIGFITFTYEGIFKAIRLMSRIILMVLSASLLSYTTTPSQMASGLEKSLSFMEKFKVPVHEMAMMVSIAFRFIPVFIEEVNIIMEAQTSRGVDFYSGSVFKRMSKVMPLVIPLFVSAISRSSDLALAMEARGYSSASERTKFRPLVYTKNDFIAYAVAIIISFIIILSRFFISAI